MDVAMNARKGDQYEIDAHKAAGIFEKDEKENVLYEYKFYRVPLETKAQGSNVDCKDDFYMVKDFLLSMTDNDWKFKQIVIPFDEKKGIYCTLGYEVIFERKK